MRVRFYTYFLLFFFGIFSVVNAKNTRVLLHTINYEKGLTKADNSQHRIDSEIRTHNHNSKSIDHHINNCKYSALLPDHFHYKVDLVESEVEIEENLSSDYDSDLVSTINLSKLYLTYLKELYSNNSYSYPKDSHLNNLLDTLFIVFRVIRL